MEGKKEQILYKKKTIRRMLRRGRSFKNISVDLREMLYDCGDLTPFKGCRTVIADGLELDYEYPFRYSGLQIADVSPLAECRRVSLRHNYALRDVTALCNVNILDISNTWVVDVSLLHNVKCLNISNTLVEDVSALHNVKELNCSNTKVFDVSPLKNVEVLNISNTSVVDLSSLGHVKVLDMSNTKVKDISPLIGVINLIMDRCSLVTQYNLESLLKKWTHIPTQDVLDTVILWQNQEGLSLGDLLDLQEKETGTPRFLRCGYNPHLEKPKRVSPLIDMNMYKYV